MLGRVPSQTYGSFEGAWKITASRKELSIASSKPPALRELRSAGHLSGGSITRREHVGGGCVSAICIFVSDSSKYLFGFYIPLTSWPRQFSSTKGG